MVPTTVGSLSVLSLWHYYVLEDKLDGSRIEYSTNNGTTWLDAAPYIMQNGYNDTTTGNLPWGTGQKVFSGVSYAQDNGQFINTLVNLSSFTGQSVQLRFRMCTNATKAGNQTYDGWFLDYITLQNGCGNMNKAGLFSGANARIDSVMNPVFIIPSALPLNLLSFTASAISQSVLLN